MIISDYTLKKMIAQKVLTVRPFHEDCVQPASIDCRLDEEFLVPKFEKDHLICLSQPPAYDTVRSQAMVIQPQSFILATTQEYFALDNKTTAFVEGRSSVGRLGLFIQNAGWVDPGFEGRITLELYNASPLPIQLIFGMRICQLVFCFLDHEATPYRGKYHKQSSTTGSRIFQDPEISLQD